MTDAQLLSRVVCGFAERGKSLADAKKYVPVIFGAVKSLGLNDEEQGKYVDLSLNLFCSKCCAEAKG